MSSPWPIPVVAQGPVAVGSVVWRMGGMVRATVVVKATFGFVLDGVARLLPPREIVREDRGPREVAETAPYLPSAGVLLAGHAYAPGGKPATSLAVRVAVYREHVLLDKTLHVFGHRPAPGAAPQPFHRVPLGWDRAFGGPGFDANPEGVGLDAGDRRGQPSIVDPVDPRRPAGFGPVPAHWGPRRRLLGQQPLPPPLQATPALVDVPGGIDLRFFHAAPADQQIDYLRGDEWIVLDGMHPTAPRARTRLPGARAEAWRYPSSAPPQPVELLADTLWIDADQQTCSVIWRGCFPLEEAPERLRIAAGLALPGQPAAIPPGHPQPAPAIQAAAHAPAAAAIDDDDDEDTPVPAPRPPPAAPSSASRRTTTQALGDDDDDSRIDATQRVRIADVARDVLPFFGKPQTPAPAARAAVPEGVLPFKPVAPARRTVTLLDDDDRTGAVDIRRLGELPFQPVAAPPPDRPSAPLAPLPGAPWGVPAVLLQPLDEEGGSTLDVRAARQPREPVPETVAPPADVTPPPIFRLVAPLPPSPSSADTLPPVVPPAVVAPPPQASAPVDAPPPIVPAQVAPPPLVAPPSSEPSAAEPPPPPAPAPAATKPVEVAVSPLREKVLAALAAKEALRGIDLRGADLRGISFRGAALAGCRLAGADLRGCDLTDARLADAVLEGADLGDAVLEGADLSRADLSRAALAGASFAKAVLTDANFTSARGPGARFAGATGQRAIFAGAVLDGAAFDGVAMTGADFTGASLAGARFDGATLIDLRLEDARGEGASFAGARLPQVHAALAAFPRASLRGVEAPGSVWERATLDEAVFAEANLEGADFSRASCNRAIFSGARAAGANFSRVTGDGIDVSGAVLERADLRQARLRDAVAEKTILRGVNAQRVDLTKARLAGADLGGGNLREAKLAGAQLAGAQLEGADLRDADLERADVTGASRRTAKMSGANVKDMVGGDG